MLNNNQQLIESLNKKIGLLEKENKKNLEKISFVAHKLRTPLTIMLGNLDLTYRELGLKKIPIPETLKTVKGEISKMVKIIKTLKTE